MQEELVDNSSSNLNLLALSQTNSSVWNPAGGAFSAWFLNTEVRTPWPTSSGRVAGQLVNPVDRPSRGSFLPITPGIREALPASNIPNGRAEPGNARMESILKIESDTIFIFFLNDKSLCLEGSQRMGEDYSRWIKTRWQCSQVQHRGRAHR